MNNKKQNVEIFILHRYAHAQTNTHTHSLIHIHTIFQCPIRIFFNLKFSKKAKQLEKNIDSINYLNEKRSIIGNGVNDSNITASFVYSI